MRINISYDEDYPGQFELWQANCRRSLKGKDGQEELKVLRDALLAMPEKKLIYGGLTDDSGGVCAIGAYARAKGLDLSKYDPEDETDEVGIEAGMPRMVAWKVVEINDYEINRHASPETRYAEMLAWVESQIK